MPTVEVHLSNPDAREAFRKNSLVAPACVGRVAGFGGASYTLALTGLLGSPAGSLSENAATRRCRSASKPRTVFRGFEQSRAAPNE